METHLRNSKPVSLYNPLRSDFTVTYATDDGPPMPYTIPSLEIKTFPSYIADHIKKHLAQEVIGSRGVRLNYDDDYKEALKEIEVTV